MEDWLVLCDMKKKVEIPIYKLRCTLYPDWDGDLTEFKEDWDRDSGTPILKKGTVWCIVDKITYCGIRGMSEDLNEVEEALEDWKDFDLIAYMKSNPYRYMLLNCIDNFKYVRSEYHELP